MQYYAPQPENCLSCKVHTSALLCQLSPLLWECGQGGGYFLWGLRKIFHVTLSRYVPGTEVVLYSSTYNRQQCSEE